MPSVAYSIALIARGTGAYAYSYLGPPGLERGQLVLVTFRSVLEIGLLLHEDQRPPVDTALLPCIPIAVQGYPGFGAVLADIAELCCSGPDEVAGHLLLDTPAKALRLSVEPGEAGLLRGLLLAEEQSALLAQKKPPRGRLSGDALLAELARLAGVLTPTRRRALLKAAGWPLLARLAAKGGLRFSLSLAGTPEVMRRHSAWCQLYALSGDQAAVLGLAAGECCLPGFYLAGLAGEPDLSTLTRVKDAPAEAHVAEPATDSEAALPWDKLKWEPRWDLVQRWPQCARLELRRLQSAWPALVAGALTRELCRAVAAGHRVLLIAPQAWMLDRLWPQLVPVADHALRYRSEAGPLVNAQLLRQASAGSGTLVAGTAGAWKLAAYQRFDRILLLDPTHPQYQPQGEPWLDPLAALCLAAARGMDEGAGSAAADGASKAVSLLSLDLIEMTVSALDGANRLDKLGIAGDEVLQQLDAASDLQQLVYFNRLGSGRGLSCSECRSAVACPRCGSTGVTFRPSLKAYACPDCDFRAPDLRCPRCGLMNLSVASPGLESLPPLAEAILLRGGSEARPPSAQTLAGARILYGTSRLLEPPLPHIARHATYVHAEASLGVLSDWPRALDMTARVALLYSTAAGAPLAVPRVISSSLQEQLGPQLSGEQIQKLLQAELKLRRLSGLPPYGCVYQLRARGLSREALEEGREQLGLLLRQDKATTLLRLGKVYSAGLEGGKRIQRFGGWLVNARLGHAELQGLRWQQHQLGVGLEYRPLRGPWI